MGILKLKEQNIDSVYSTKVYKLILSSRMRLSFGYIILIEIHGVYIKNNLKRQQATTRNT